MSKQQYGDSQLVYDAAYEDLRIEIGKDGPKTFKAYSGGSRGHKVSVSPEQAKSYLHGQANSLSSRFATTGELIDKHGKYIRRGGTLPPGHYKCRYVPLHPVLKECVQLTGLADTQAIDSPFASMPISTSHRNGFYIHGSGPKGSDGCIVVMTHAELRYICDTIVGFPSSAILLVKNEAYQLPAENFTPGSRRFPANVG